MVKARWFEGLKRLTLQKKELSRRETRYCLSRETHLKSTYWSQWTQTLSYQQSLNARASSLGRLLKQKFLTLWVSVHNNRQGILS